MCTGPENPSPPLESLDSGEESLDKTLETILAHFRHTHRLDHAHELMQRSLRNRLASDYNEAEARLLEVNLFGSLSGWMAFMLQERMQDRDAVPDFARHLRRAFLAHCRTLEIDPDVALKMAVELANVLMDLAASYQRHLHLEDDEASPA